MSLENLISKRLLLLFLSQLMILTGGPDLLHWRIFARLCIGNDEAMSCKVLFWLIFFMFIFTRPLTHNRHSFVLQRDDKLQIWTTVEKLLIDSQVEASFFPCTCKLQCIIFMVDINFKDHIFNFCTKNRKTYSTQIFLKPGVLVLSWHYETQGRDSNNAFPYFR